MAMGTLMSVAMAQGQVCAQSLGEKFTFRVKEKTLGPALEEIYQLTGVPLLYPHALATTEGVNPVIGSYTVEQALDILLGGTGFSGGLANGGVIVISLNNKDREEAPMTSGTLKKSLLASVGVLMFGAAHAQDVERVEEDKKQEVDNITVTGTSIRGVAPDSSPSFVFDKEDIEKTGFGTVSELIQSLPQNFGGGANADSAVSGLPTDFIANTNLAASSSVNLRGAGSGATLVLLNGARLAPAGNRGAFTDISMIPLSAVERVEVLTDGASAIYGADAIAGVVNFVLRDNYDGAESFARIGSVTEGDMSEYRAGQTFGKSWHSGNALVSYEFFHRDPLGVEHREVASAIPQPFDLIPGQESHSLLLTGSQQITKRVKLRGHTAYSQRDTENVYNCCGGFVTSQPASTEQYGGLAALEVELSSDWFLDISGDYNDLSENITVLIPDFSLEDFHTNQSNLWSVDVKLDGKLTDLPGGELKIATGVGYREESFAGAINTIVMSKADRRIRSGFGEIFAPIIGEGNRRPGVERLELTLAGRYDDYSDFGSTFNPKAGLLYSPADGLSLRGTFSTSFNPPNLGFTGSRTGSMFVRSDVPDPSSPTGTSIVIFDSRANSDLGPENSTAWTAGFDYHKELGNANLALSFTWFNIDFVDRIDVPTASFFSILNDTTTFSDVINFDPDPSYTAEIIADVEANGSGFFNASGGAWAVPGDEDYVLDVRLRNLASKDTSGLDFNLTYAFETVNGDLSFEFNGSYLLNQDQKITSSSPVIDVTSRIFNPVDLRFRSGASWDRDGWGVSTFVNYVDSYVDDRNLFGGGDLPVDSWTTVDFTLSHDTGEQAGSSLRDNVKFSLSVINLFDQNTPSIESGPSSFYPLGYDPTNADVLGRFASFQISKSW